MTRVSADFRFEEALCFFESFTLLRSFNSEQGALFDPLSTLAPNIGLARDTRCENIVDVSIVL